jgi:hypothetical protein
VLHILVADRVERAVAEERVQVHPHGAPRLVGAVTLDHDLDPFDIALLPDAVVRGRYLAMKPCIPTTRTASSTRPRARLRAVLRGSMA